MNIWDKVYYVNSSRTIDEYIVIEINGNEALIGWVKDQKISTYIDISRIETSKYSRIFKNYDNALKLKAKLDKKYKEAIQKYYDSILEEVFNSVTLDQVEKYGILLKEKETKALGKWSG